MEGLGSISNVHMEALLREVRRGIIQLAFKETRVVSKRQIQMLDEFDVVGYDYVGLKTLAE